MAASLKYPCLADYTNNGGYKKFGVFKSEKEIINEVWNETGLYEGIRHPFAHIMEACDDIAYAVLDAEDTIKKGFASYYDLIDHLNGSNDEIVKKVVKKSIDKNEEYKKENLSSSELNEISMQMFRVFAIYHLVDSATKTFVDNVNKILTCKIPDGFELIKNSSGHELCKLLKGFDNRHGFQNKQVLELELVGQNTIDSTMSMFWKAISNSRTPFSRYATALISENYRRVHEKSIMDDNYKKCQLLCDFISGMSDTFLINTHKKLSKLYRDEKISKP